MKNKSKNYETHYIQWGANYKQESMNINKEMAEHMLRYYLEYPHEHLSREIKDVIVLIKYLMGEIEELKKEKTKDRK